MILGFTGDYFWFQWQDNDPNIHFKTSFDQLMAFLQVLKPIFFIWAIMAHTRVITSFQSLCGIGLKHGVSTCKILFLMVKS